MARAHLFMRRNEGLGLMVMKPETWGLALGA